jgi:hypothetical protein
MFKTQLIGICFRRTRHAHQFASAAKISDAAPFIITQVRVGSALIFAKGE